MIRWLKIIASMMAVFIVLVIVAAVGIHRGANAPPDKVPVSAPPQSAPPPFTWDRSDEAKVRRAKLIESLQRQGLFGDLKVSGGVGEVVTGPTFYGLDFKAKGDFASVAFTWCLDHDPACSLLVLKDRLMGKEVGRYGAAYNGLKME